MQTNLPSFVSKKDIRFAVVTRDRTFLMPNPSSSATPLAVISIATIVPVLAPIRFREKISEGGRRIYWLHVRFDGMDGFVNSQFAIADVSPVCTGFVRPEGNYAKLLASFQSESSAERVFDEVHYSSSQPHLKLGFGHFSEGEQNAFFRSMLEDSRMRPVLLDRFASALLSNGSFQAQARAEGYDLGMNGRVEGLEAFLEQADWESGMITYRNSGNFPGRGLKNGYWLNDILVDVLRNDYLCAWQLRHWLQTTVQQAVSAAKMIGLSDHYGAVATLVSLKDSGCDLFASLREAWMQNPVHPNPVQKDLAALNLWLYYNKIRGRLRGRQRAIYRLWFQPSWGDLPAGFPTDKTAFQYTGVPMETDASGTAFHVDPEDPYVMLLNFLGD